MSDVVRLHVPPFAPAAPRSLAALRRPLIQPDHTVCEAHCQPCETCQAEQQAQIEQARKTASDLGLRLSQLVEDGLEQHISRIEAQQSELITRVLATLLPHLAQDSLRRTVHEELAAALSDPLREEALHLRKSPTLDLGPLPESSRLSVIDDAALPADQIRLEQGDAETRIDARPIIDLCLARLGQEGVDPEFSQPPVSEEVSS